VVAHIPIAIAQCEVGDQIHCFVGRCPQPKDSAMFRPEGRNEYGKMYARAVVTARVMLAG